MQAKKIIIVVLMLLTSFSAFLLKPSEFLSNKDPVKLDVLVPESFGDWRYEQNVNALILPPELEASVNRLYSQTISRTYVNQQGQRVMLSIAYSENQSDNAGKQSHRPEVCYPAQGFIIIENLDGTLAIKGRMIPIRYLVAIQDARKEFITYWITVGRKPATTGFNIKLNQLKYSVEGLIADGIIFRVSTIGDDKLMAYEIQKKFIEDLTSAMPKNSARFFIGSK